MKTLTVAICSYQRRDSLVRLLRALAEQAAADPEGWTGVDVVVAVDGSTDGSAPAARAVRSSLPTAVIDQPHAGPAAARNRCLQEARGELLYYLDDDLVPAPGTLLRHRRAPREGAVRLVLGPCVIPADHAAPSKTRTWFATRYEELERAGVIRRFDHFSVANASGPTEDFRSVGGFDTGFVGYGLEDYEIGLRLMQRGIYERFDAEAVAWHYTAVGDDAIVPRNRQTGRNAVRLLRRHPGEGVVMLPDRYSGPGPWLVDRMRVRSPRVLMAVARVAEWSAHRLAKTPPAVEGNLWAAAAAAAQAAGVADLDPSLVPAFLGRPAPPTTGRRWDRVPVRPDARVRT
ncbi:MAG TPA: glycosyltransferase [Acidimicrobiales bacterium]|nr:glycosyltransferase [Acidimicrobiales bacterium]